MTVPSVWEVVRRTRATGVRDVSRRVARRLAGSLAAKFDTAELDFPLLTQDIADSTRLLLEPPAATVGPARGLELAVLCTPPGPGSGGHTTLFRMVSGLEERGHRCALLLYDRHGSNLDEATAIIRRHWPRLRAEVRPVPPILEGYDGCIASSWETAHVLATRGRTAMHRFYFIQDFEPYFYPRGSLYSLAEDTYRFGLRNIALGHMVASAIRDNVGIDSAFVPFGCDTEVYSLRNLGERRGVVFYARQTVDRRGFLLGKLALEEFHQRHPEQPVHIYGDPVTRWDVPHTHHGKLSPDDLSVLYNSCLAGLAMSFTNISLVAEEMLACGMTPVVNDHPFARSDLPAQGVIWAQATPGALADAMSRAVEQPRSSRQTIAFAGAARKGWATTQGGVAQIIEAEVAGPFRGSRSIDNFLVGE